MRLAVVCLGLVAVLGAGCSSSSPVASGRSLLDPGESVAATATARASATVRPARTPHATAGLLALGPTGPTQDATVTRVVDGDTIIVEVGGKEERLRYIGINAPETVKPNTPVQWMGPEASAADKQLVGGRTVTLEKDVSERDQYGRLLRDVWLRNGDRWLLVNLELVRLGVAQVSTFPPDVKYVDELLATQRDARAAGVGLWGLEPSPTP